MFLAVIILLLTVLWYSKWIFYLSIGLYTALLFSYDKYAAMNNRWRIPEKRLLIISFLGGAPFALATIFLIRHKCSKPEFYLPVVFFTGIHVFLMIMF